MQKLFNRFEFKYPVRRSDAYAIYDELISHGMQKDSYAEKCAENAYIVTSLYFDSPTLSDYYDKSGGFLERKKIRVRIYDSELTEKTSPIWIERKEKHDMMIKKRRISISRDEYVGLLGGSHMALIKRHKNNPFFNDIIAPIIRGNMRPRIVVQYFRKPLVSATEPEFRITFDSNIEACKASDLRYNHAMQSISDDKTVIMEVKYSYILPSWFKSIIKKYNLRRDAFSKYTHSLEAIVKYNPIPR